MTRPSFRLVGDDLRYERWRWQVFFITWLAYFGYYLTRKTFSVAKIGMDQDPSLDISRSEMAWIDGAYLTAYAIGQFISGVLGDRAGTRWVVTTGMFASAIAATAMGASSVTVLFGVLFGLQGLCQSTGWAPLVKNVGNFFSRHERGTVIGMWSTCYAAGGMVASVFAGYWGDLLGWRYAFFVPAATLAGIGLLFLIFQRNRPEDVGLPPIEAYHNEQTTAPGAAAATDLAERKSSRELVRQVLFSRTVLVICLAYFLTKPARYAILFWGPKYIQEKLGSGMAESGALSALFELAGIVGALSAGIISDRVFNARRMPVCVIALIVLGLFMLFMDSLPTTRVVLGTSYLLMGLLVFMPDTILNGAAAVDFGGRHGAGTVAGFVNGAGSAGAILGGIVPGLFSEHWGWGGVFTLLGTMALTGGVILLPEWNALPVTAAAEQVKSDTTK